MKRPIQETETLLKASRAYLREQRPETERAFFQALAALEAAEQERPSVPLWGAAIQGPGLMLGAAAILAVLIGLFVFYRAAVPSFLAAQTPTLASALPSAVASQMPGAIVCPDGMDQVPQGLFLMGAGDQDGNALADEKPQRSVSLRAFCIDPTEVSNVQYALFLKSTNHASPPGWNGSHYPANVNQNYKDLPVVNVSWFDARDYCTWRRKQLPTEAQWEKAARGPDGLIYPWGNTFDATRANYGGTTPRGLQPVKSNPGGQSRYRVLNQEVWPGIRVAHLKWEQVNQRVER
jgi:formylglycine-generating enzyme required for sulfatase activity